MPVINICAEDDKIKELVDIISIINRSISKYTYRSHKKQQFQHHH